MNATLLYIAFIVSLAYSAIQSYHIFILFIQFGSVQKTSIYYYLFPLAVVIASTILFYKKYKSSLIDQAGQCSFAKSEVLPTAGVIGMVIGLVWLSSELRMAVEITSIERTFSYLTAEKVFPPIILTGFGIFYGFFAYKSRA